MTAKSSLAPKTATTYAEGVKLFVGYLAEHPLLRQLQNTDQRLAHASRMVVQDWLNVQTAAGIQRSTRNVRECAIRSLYQFLASEHGGSALRSHPYSRNAKLMTLPQLRGRRFALTESMIQDVLLGFHNEAERTLWHFAYDVGPRIGELTIVKKSAIDAAFDYYQRADRTGNSIRYVPMILPTIKKGGSEIVDMISLVSIPTLTRVVRYHESDAYQLSPRYQSSDPSLPAFLTVNGLPWKYQNARKQLIKACSRASIALPKNVTPHIFRHSSAASILSSTDHGADHVSRFISMSMQLRHSGLQVSEIYAHLSPAEISQLSADDTVYKRSERILKATYLSPRKHSEKRGHTYHGR
jgi:integrase/recombinase XerC